VVRHQRGPSRAAGADRHARAVNAASARQGRSRQQQLCRSVALLSRVRTQNGNDRLRAPSRKPAQTATCGRPRPLPARLRGRPVARRSPLRRARTSRAARCLTAGPQTSRASPATVSGNSMITEILRAYRMRNFHHKEAPGGIRRSEPSWRCRESNPGPSVPHQDFSERSLHLFFSAPAITQARRRRAQPLFDVLARPVAGPAS